MMKMMILAPRKDGMTRLEFRRYVTDVHGPLVISVPEVASAIRHYHYNFPILSAQDTAFDHPSARQLDIVTQGWFDSRDAQLKNMAEPQYLKIVRPDEHRFADGARAVMHYTNEVEVVAGPSAGVKVFYFRRRRADLSREEFQHRWRTQFAQTLISNSAFTNVAVKYVQNHTFPEADHPDGGAPKYFDVIDELFIRGPDSIATLALDTAAVDRVRLLERELLDPAFTRALITETVVNIP